jgi:hypothetical protein
VTCPLLLFFLSLESLAPTHKLHIFRTTLICVCVCVFHSFMAFSFLFFIGPGGPGAPHKLHFFGFIQFLATSRRSRAPHKSRIFRTTLICAFF